jgi:hypothetical protein
MYVHWFVKPSADGWQAPPERSRALAHQPMGSGLSESLIQGVVLPWRTGKAEWTLSSEQGDKAPMGHGMYVKES